MLCDLGLSESMNRHDKAAIEKPSGPKPAAPRNAQSGWAILAGALGVMLTGCAGHTVEIERGDGPLAGAGRRGGPPSCGPVVMDWSDWGLTLSRVVAGEKVDYGSLLPDHEALDRFLSLVARVGPETTPDQFADRNSQLAYAINCYNATILRSVVEIARGKKHRRDARATRRNTGETPVPHNDALPSSVPLGWERRYRFRIDGRLVTPAELRRSAEELAGNDWRVRLALCDGREPGPPLPRHSFLGDLLDGQLDRVTRSALASPQVVSIDHGAGKRLLVWQGLYDMKDGLIRAYEERLHTRDASLLNVLLEWSDRPRRELLNTAVGYTVASMAPGNRFNALEPTGEEAHTLSSVMQSIKSFSFLKP